MKEIAEFQLHKSLTHFLISHTTKCGQDHFKIGPDLDRKFYTRICSVQLQGPSTSKYSLGIGYSS